MSESAWDRHWGMRYDSETKREMAKDFLCAAEERGRIGDVIVDVGSGTFSLTNFLSHPHRVINIDIAGYTERRMRDELYLRFDVEKMLDRHAVETRRALGLIARFLKIDGDHMQEPQVDTFFFSEILNYIDWKNILAEANTYLKPGGTFFILNRPDRGFKTLFSENGLKDNKDLLAFLQQIGHEIVVKEYPWGDDDKSTNMIMLLSKKPPVTEAF